MIFIICLQAIKQEYRIVNNINESSISKVVALSNLIEKRLFDLDSLVYRDIIASAFMRFNEGWIVNKVMKNVPHLEPYANGGTILKGLYSAFVPRLLDPDKPVAGGRENFEKYTGIELNQNTAMSIGVIGEMYANFGYGGVIGMAFYGYLIGLLYLLLYNKAVKNPVWWVWGPYLGFMAMKSEEGLMETMTWIVKSLVIMVTVIFICNKMRKRDNRYRVAITQK
jgi:hypothetical protein